MKYIRIILCIILLPFAAGAMAQDIAVKTNLIDDRGTILLKDAPLTQITTLLSRL